MRRAFLAVLLFVASAATAGAQAQPSQVAAAKPTQLFLKVGLALKDEASRDPSWESPDVKPIGDATVVLIDANDIVIGVQKTDKEGLTNWPHQKEKFSALIFVVGRNLDIAQFEKDESTAKVLVVLERQQK